MNNVAGGHMSCLRGSFKVPKSTDYQKKSGKVFDKRDANPCNEGNAQARKCKRIMGSNLGADNGVFLLKYLLRCAGISWIKICSLSKCELHKFFVWQMSKNCLALL